MDELQRWLVGIVIAIGSLGVGGISAILGGMQIDVMERQYAEQQEAAQRQEQLEAFENLWPKFQATQEGRWFRVQCTKTDPATKAQTITNGLLASPQLWKLMLERQAESKAYWRAVYFGQSSANDE